MEECFLHRLSRMPHPQPAPWPLPLWVGGTEELGFLFSTFKTLNRELLPGGGGWGWVGRRLQGWKEKVGEGKCLKWCVRAFKRKGWPS